MRWYLFSFSAIGVACFVTSMVAINSPEEYAKAYKGDDYVLFSDLSTVTEENGLFVSRSAVSGRYQAEFSVLRCYFFGCFESQVKFRRGKEVSGGLVQIINPSEAISRDDIVMIRSWVSARR